MNTNLGPSITGTATSETGTVYICGCKELN